MNTSPKTRKLYIIILSIVAWFALIGQLYLIILNRSTSFASTLIRYISYFTILTNLLVALCSTSLLINKKNSKPSFFSKLNTIAAITVYITVVGLVYNLILRFSWQPQGLQLIVDELLHTVVPILFILFWLLFVPKAGLKAKNILPWLLYPFVYVIYILIRGAITGEYPYPFIDMAQLGYSKVLLNSGILVVVFIVFSLFFVWMDNLKRISTSRLAA